MQGKVIALDCTKKEEEVMENRISVCLNIYSDLCLVQKPGGSPAEQKVLLQIVDVCKFKV